MSEPVKVKRCKEPHCKVHIDGKCMDTLDVDKGECKNFYMEDGVEADVEQTVQNDIKKPAGVKLYEGKEMDMQETAEITHKYPVKVIAIVGESNCGKTTLLSELYNIFQKGTNQDLLFAGSHTLIGFEQRSHLSRVESNSENAETGKTVSRVFSFLHLALKKKSESLTDAVHILLSDIAGEHFQFARDSSSTMKELNLLTDAEQVIYIIDGEKLAAKKLRQQTLSNAETFIKTAVDNGVFNQQTNLTVIVSKWDKLITDTTFNFDAHLKVSFTEKFAFSVKNFKAYQVAARPKTAVVNAGYGLYELLNDCYTIKKELVVTGPKPGFQNTGRDFHQLKVRAEL
jgi:hypothetical protein